MKGLTIGELSKLTGLASQAIRYYEKEKLMPAPERTDSNYRIYDEGAVARLHFILNAKQWGFTLEEIRELLILQDANGSRAEAKRIATEKLERIQAQIEKLTRIRKVLEQTLTECSGEGPMLEGCPIVEAIADSDQ